VHARVSARMHMWFACKCLRACANVCDWMLADVHVNGCVGGKLGVQASRERILWEQHRDSSWPRPQGGAGAAAAGH
jgi:hypothetical protein